VRWLRGLVSAERLLLVLIAAAAACAYAWSLNSDGLEAYYAAGVRSMSVNWHAFVYGAFDQRATVTLDKLPGAFWVQALSVRAFGYSVWSLVLPQVVESTLTVLVLHRAVRRTAGPAAALAAAAMLAASPVTIASTRGDLSEPLYLLCLVLAADAVLRFVVDQRWRSAGAAAVWVAVAFQAKMAEAWLVLPALTVALIAGAGAGAGTGRLRAVIRAGAVALLAAILSLTWVCAFVLTPASQRPVADGSAHNSIFEQVFRYNGGSRFDGGIQFGLRPLAAPTPEAEEIAAQKTESAQARAAYPPSVYSQPGWDRLFVGPLAPDCAWFLPCAAVGALTLLRVRRRAGRGDPMRTAALLWLLWLLVYGAVFSAAGLIHDYYLATLVPAVAALSGMGLSVLWTAARAGRRRAVSALSVLIAVQGAWCALLLIDHQGPLWCWTVAASGALAAVGVAFVRRRGEPSGRAGPVAVLTAVLAVAAGFTAPLAASGWLLERAGGPFDTPFAAVGTLAKPTPSAAAARARAQGRYGGVIVPSVSAETWSGLLAAGLSVQRTQASRHTEVLVFASSEAAWYVMGGVAAVLPIGGFSGNVPYPSVAEVERLIRDGRVSTAVVPGSDDLGGTDPRVVAVKSLCRVDGVSSRPDRLVYACTR
jgi:4-amino-4-deoxy-L-arabinose transferase-like glycosyltransferase